VGELDSVSVTEATGNFTFGFEAGAIFCWLSLANVVLSELI
jgi:hypothetical protein